MKMADEKIVLGKINIISGERGVGKTILCSNLKEELTRRGFSAAGIISPGIYFDNVKIGIAALNIKNGEKVKLADYSPGWDIDNPLRMWKINSGAIRWGNEVLKNSTPCDVLIIDDIGYLEFEKHTGWYRSIDLIKEEKFKIAFIVVRKDLVEIAHLYWKNAQIIKIENSSNIKYFLKSIIDQVMIEFNE